MPNSVQDSHQGSGVDPSQRLTLIADLLALGLRRLRNASSSTAVVYNEKSQANCLDLSAPTRLHGDSVAPNHEVCS